ncbi:MAG TPA: phasin family protein [Candidatus Competibacteraceae bacterium]|nr:phasin family protein [Candidatus Competibacteraceae bacterium]
MVATVTTKLIDNPMADNAIEYARQVWLAGLGALAKAEKEGNKLLDTLVQRGEELEAQAMQKAEDAVEDLKDRLGGVRESAVSNLNKLEKAFQKRVKRALHRLGVPNRDDIQDLARQVKVLQESIQEMIKAEEARMAPRKANIRRIGEAA